MDDHQNASRGVAIRRRLFGTLRAILWAIAILVVSEPSIRQALHAQTTPPAAATAQVEVTSDAVEVWRKAAAESTSIDADTKQKIEAAAVQALDGLSRIRELAGLAEKYKRDADSIQQRVAQARDRLAQLQGEPPPLPTNLNLPELEQEVARREVELAQLKAAQSMAEGAASARVNLRREIRTKLLSANEEISVIQQQLDTPAPADEPPLLTQARQALWQVRRRLIEAEQPALQHELAKYDAEDAVGFLRLERDVVAQEVRISGDQLQELQSVLSRRRAADSAAAVQRARSALDSASLELKPAAEENLELAEAAHALAAPLAEERRKLKSTTTRLEELRKQFKLAQRRVNDIGLTGSIGALLRKQRTDLPDVQLVRVSIWGRRDAIETAQYEYFSYDDRRSETIDETVDRILDPKTVSSVTKRQELNDEARSLARQRREYLDGVIRNYDAYLDALFQLETTERQLIRETEAYQTYIDERVLWIRSNRTLFASFEIDETDAWVVAIAPWKEVASKLTVDCRENLPLYLIGLAAFVTLTWQRSRCRRQLATFAEPARRGSCTDFAPTLRAAGCTLMLALAWPGVVYFLGWRLYVSADVSHLSTAVAQALFAVAWLYFPLELMRHVCRQDGLADAHFNWPPAAIGVLRANLRWVSFVGLAVVFVTSLLYFSAAEHGSDAIERVCFIVGMLALAVFSWRVMHPATGVFRRYLVSHPGGWLDRLRPVWFGGCVLIPLAFAGLVVAGYYYTAQQLAGRLYSTLVLIIAVELLRDMLQRLLLVRRRAISIEQARQRSAAAAANQAEETDVPQQPPEQFVAPEELQLDVAEKTEQSQRLIRTATIATAVVGIWLIWVDVLPALQILDKWPVWTSSVPGAVETPEASSPAASNSQTPADDESEAAASQPTGALEIVSVADIGLAILIGMVTIVCARNIPGLMEIAILERLPVDRSIRYAVTSITSYAIILIGIVLAFNAIAIRWSTVQWLATALTFGLAFGLQEIFANFVAGLILLFERPIRVGDVVTIDNITGVVSRIRVRATTITDWDRKEYIIPNKEFITGRTLNWTLSDKTNRIVINVGVAYGSDVDRAKQLLLQICKDQPLILDDPATMVTFEGFGDNTLNLIVRTYLPDLDNRLQVIDKLHSTIDQAFRDARIEIAFPQRDLHLRSIDREVLDRLSGAESRERDENAPEDR